MKAPQDGIKISQSNMLDKTSAFNMKLSKPFSPARENGMPIRTFFIIFN